MNLKYYWLFLAVLLLVATPLIALSQDSDIKSLSPAQQQALWYGEAYSFLNSPYPYSYATYAYGIYPYSYYTPFYYPYTSHYPGYSFRTLPTYPSVSYGTPVPVTAPTPAYTSTASIPIQAYPSSTAAYSMMTATSPTLGTYLTDGKGRTLYHLQTDQGSYASKCTDATCTGSWPPFYSASINVPQNLNPSDFSTINVNGYKKYQQTAFKGWPLYYFYGDTKSGAINGQGLQDNYGIWSVVNPESPNNFPASTPYYSAETAVSPMQQPSTAPMTTSQQTSTMPQY